MDEQVLRSLAKWPNVPDCFGWLALDRRGQWRMRDEFAQTNKLPGQVIEHVAFKEYISRNYSRDSMGRYFFQNGPQRVFVTLDATPWIARITPSNDGLQLMTQCHSSIEPSGALSDENGNIYIVGLVKQATYQDPQNHSFTQQKNLTVALLHDHDLDHFSELASLREEACSFGGSWNWQGKQLPLDPIHSGELATQFHFVATPNPNSQA
ncbi:DUF2946 family protein [Polynucleobacter sp. AP-Kolm-20A-A1]|uniref:DUF2946 family protein n=1 Tax=Polynucleobacter sp. AP-Kolm-20A-A1 TaxID=2081041 RepID=UPI001BFE3963|nr:DUF2946 family protein [Polynucleobacter sp. AP-Kolm-20A-A1]QWE20404.1 DUF2946 family protein [Polynucleobacter sp. AP-Kolm-20A-A1]